MLKTYRAVIGAEPAEFDSARDDYGHGTHTASTAAGDPRSGASIFGLPVAQISGIAPRARIVAYKALGELGGFTSDLAAAIDQAVADGVDVINYSIGGGAGLPAADEIAMLFAADAGVFIATSAGNDGPGPGTVGNPADDAVGHRGRREHPAAVLPGRRHARRRHGAIEGASITHDPAARPVGRRGRRGQRPLQPGKLDPAKVDRQDRAVHPRRRTAVWRRARPCSRPAASA